MRSFVPNSMLCQLLLMLGVATSTCDAFSIGSSKMINSSSSSRRSSRRAKTLPTTTRLNSFDYSFSGVDMPFGTSLNAAVESVGGMASSLQGLTVALDGGAAAAAGGGGGGGGDNGLIFAGAAVVALVGIAVAATSARGNGNGKDVVAKVVEEPEPEPIDVSIPYDATTILAFQEWRPDGQEPDLKSPLFVEFKTLYLEKMVAEVTMKEKTRKFERLLASSQ